MAKRWGRVWAVGFVLWTLLAFLSAAGSHVYTASTDRAYILGAVAGLEPHGFDGMVAAHPAGL